MNNKIKLIFFSFSLLFLVFSFSFFAYPAVAQTSPEFIVSWRALNYVPADYLGKSLPIETTPIEVGFDLIDGGKIVNLSANLITWSLNDTIFQSANGLKSIRFTLEGADREVGIKIANYKGAALNKFFIIPRRNPEVIISSRLPSSEIKLGDYNLEARPFFFNISRISELSFNWTNNSQLLPTTGPVLNINPSSQGTPKETVFNFSLTVANLVNQLESAIKSFSLTLKP